MSRGMHTILGWSTRNGPPVSPVDIFISLRHQQPVAHPSLMQLIQQQLLQKVKHHNKMCEEALESFETGLVS